MKKNILFLILLVLMLALSACSSTGETASDTGDQASVASNTEGTPAAGDQTALSDTVELMIGTMLLDSTDQAVDAAKAGTLLTLWKAYRSLNDSETSAAAELDAVVKQIKGEMTPEQLAAIEALQLTNANMMEKMQQAGIQVGMGPGFDPNVSQEDMQATRQALEASGQLPEGMAPGGDRPEGDGPPMGGAIQGGEGAPMGEGFPMGGVNPEDMDPAQLATMQAQRDSMGSRRGQGSEQFLITALITFLEGKTAAE
jgi:hypothetical protein